MDVQISVPERPEFPEIAIAPVQPISEMDMADEPVDVNEIELLPSETKAQVVPTQEPKTVSEVIAKSEESNITTPEVVKVTKEPVPIADRWTLQVATFGKQENAARTLKKLQDAGYSAYVITTNSLFKVFVGPELKREESEKMKQKVLKEFKLSGIVVKYAPNS